MVRDHRAPSRSASSAWLFSDQIENGARNLYLIGTTLIVLGLVLLAAEAVGNRDARASTEVRRSDAIWIGLAQALALMPGVSRSGSTITAGLFLDMKREAAARFSFLLSIPAIVLSGLFGLTELLKDGGDVGVARPSPSPPPPPSSSATSRSRFLLRYLASHSTLVFVIYRVVLGTTVIALAAGDVIS